MKVKDVIAKISNGEKVKARHRLFDIDYYGRKDFHIRYNFESSDGLSLADIIRILDDDIEIIEEDKKIERLEPTIYTENGIEIMSVPSNELMVSKINELIDEVNKLKEKE